MVVGVVTAHSLALLYFVFYPSLASLFGAFVREVLSLFSFSFLKEKESGMLPRLTFRKCETSLV